MFDYDVKIGLLCQNGSKEIQVELNSISGWILSNIESIYFSILLFILAQVFLKYNRSIFRNWPIDQLHVSLLSRNFFFHDLSRIILQKQYCRFLEKRVRTLEMIEKEIKFHQSCKFHRIGENLYTLGKISTLNDDPNDYPKLLLTSLEDDYCWKLGPDISKNLKPDFVAPKLHQTREL